MNKIIHRQKSRKVTALKTTLRKKSDPARKSLLQLFTVFVLLCCSACSFKVAPFELAAGFNPVAERPIVRMENRDLFLYPPDQAYDLIFNSLHTHILKNTFQYENTFVNYAIYLPNRFSRPATSLIVSSVIPQAQGNPYDALDQSGYGMVAMYLSQLLDRNAVLLLVDLNDGPQNPEAIDALIESTVDAYHLEDARRFLITKSDQRLLFNPAAFLSILYDQADPSDFKPDLDRQLYFVQQEDQADLIIDQALFDQPEKLNRLLDDLCRPSVYTLSLCWRVDSAAALSFMAFYRMPSLITWWLSV